MVMNCFMECVPYEQPVFPDGTIVKKPHHRYFSTRLDKN